MSVQPAAPRAALSSLLICAVVCVAFAITGPWTTGRVTVLHWETIFTFCVLAMAVSLIDRNSRVYVNNLLHRDITIGRRSLLIAFAVASVFLIRMTFAKYNALEVSAWDFSISFDRPIQGTVHGDLLWSETLRKSTLGTHCNWLLLAFVPLYAIAPSPYWLLIAQAMAIAGAAAALFHFGRAVTADDFVASCVACAFLVNRYTAHATQFVFIIDIFYPLALFLMFYAMVRGKRGLFFVALLLTLSIKEDAIVPLTGFATTAAFVYRRWIWASMTVVSAASVFLFDYFFVQESLCAAAPEPTSSEPSNGHSS